MAQHHFWLLLLLCGKTKFYFRQKRIQHFQKDMEPKKVETGRTYFLCVFLFNTIALNILRNKWHDTKGVPRAIVWIRKYTFCKLTVVIKFTLCHHC